jgi:diguanylate cyclase (GGDEF)-like protein
VLDSKSIQVFVFKPLCVPMRGIGKNHLFRSSVSIFSVLGLIGPSHSQTLMLTGSNRQPSWGTRKVLRYTLDPLGWTLAVGILLGVVGGGFFPGFKLWMLPAIAVTTYILYIAFSRQRYRAEHDALTGLPNRYLFLKLLGWALHSSASNPLNHVGTIVLDINRFKTINDCLGQKSGDLLLKDVAQRLEGCLRNVDCVARVGGDEFAILVDRVHDVEDLLGIAQRVRRQFKRPFYLNGQPVFTTASIGVAIDDGSDRYNLLRQAHMAMYRAKTLGKTQPELFEATVHAQAVEQFQLELDLRQSMAHSRVFSALPDREVRRWIEQENSGLPHSQLGDEFRVYYQPLIDLKSGRVVGFEALVRWQHHQRGLICPDRFIRLAEDTDLILPLGAWILREACQQTRRWQEQFPHEVPLIVSVNLSTKQFLQSDLAQQIAQTLSHTHLDPCSLKLEITEGIAMEDVTKTLKILQQLQALKVRLGIDDFGTGYSSLSYLTQFPIDTLKIDRSFVGCMTDTAKNLAIVNTIIILAKTLGLDVIAEGIETPEQLLMLRNLDCQYGQGFFFAEPLSSQDATKLLADRVQF